MLEDVRGICGDLHMPEIDGLSLREAVAFTILDHEHRTGAPVNVQAMDLPAAVPPLVKVCLCRFLKEGLNGTVRIGAGTSPRLSVRHEAGVVIEVLRALPEGALVVNSSQGGGSKDTWVLASRTSVADRELGAAEVVRSLPKAAAGKGVTKSGKADSTQDQQQQQ